MRSSSHSGQPQRTADRPQTAHPQRHPGDCPPGLYVVGIGPGHIDHLSLRAHDVLCLADTIVGYGAYVDLVRPLIPGKQVVSTGMTKEVDRVSVAIDMALEGRRVALISSGDPGVYAMAGLALEMCAVRNLDVLSQSADVGSRLKNDKSLIFVEVVPGIPALCAGAALLGAPLMHDFCAISLSDLLTPWEVIEKRLHAAAEADFVMAIYNPKSKKRNWQLESAQKILLTYRSGRTPVGVVTAAMRDDQQIVLTTLEKLHQARVTMQSTVFIGNCTTRHYGDLLLTPRGYSGKYNLHQDGTGSPPLEKKEDA